MAKVEGIGISCTSDQTRLQKMK